MGKKIIIFISSVLLTATIVSCVVDDTNDYSQELYKSECSQIMYFECRQNPDILKRDNKTLAAMYFNDFTLDDGLVLAEAVRKLIENKDGE